MELINHIRFYHYIAAVLEGQQSDPLCSRCRALTNTVSALRESLKAMENEHRDQMKVFPDDMYNLYEEAVSRIASLKTYENAEGQKKAGNCRMPKGVCFVKSSKAVLGHMSD